jgi:hypothetical protein
MEFSQGVTSDVPESFGLDFPKTFPESCSIWINDPAKIGASENAKTMLAGFSEITLMAAG